MSLNFGNDLISINEKLALYNLLITSYHETHNNNQESYFTQLCKSINDSIQNAKMKFQVDSLKEALEKQKNTPTSTNEEDGIGEQITSSTSDSTNNPFIIAIIGAIVIGVLLFFILKSRNNSTTSVKKSSVEIPKIDARDHKNINALVEKIAKVELVFIRAEVLGEYGNKKSVVKIINDYNEQLPLIIKNLDEAISTNDNEPIINALSYLKPYLTAFGMAATLAMLNEVEAEAPTEKTTKLLSRVFQIRNHIRRAHDETKALIEVLG